MLCNRGFGPKLWLCNHPGTLRTKLWQMFIICGRSFICWQLPILLPSTMGYMVTLDWEQCCLSALDLDKWQSWNWIFTWCGMSLFNKFGKQVYLLLNCWLFDKNPEKVWSKCWSSQNWSVQGETKIFKSFKARFPTPYKASNSTSPLWYSIKRGSAHIIVLASYSSYGEQKSIIHK
jgi:hypothetical protein